MIARYTRPALTELWSDRHRYDTWLRVELAACARWRRPAASPRGTAARRAGEGGRQARPRAHPRARGADQARRHRVPDPRRGAGRRAGALAAPGDDLVRRARRGAGDHSWWRRPTRSWPALDLAARRLPPPRRGAPRRRPPSAARTASTPSRSRPGWCSPGSTPSSGGRGPRWSRARTEIAVGKIAGAVGTYANLEPAIEVEGAGGARPSPGDRPDADRRARSPRRLLRGAGAHRHRESSGWRSPCATGSAPRSARRWRRSARDRRAPRRCRTRRTRSSRENLCGLARLLRGVRLPPRSRTSRSGTSATSRTRRSSG